MVTPVTLIVPPLDLERISKHGNTPESKNSGRAGSSIKPISGPLSSSMESRGVSPVSADMLIPNQVYRNYQRRSSCEVLMSPRGAALARMEAVKDFNIINKAIEQILQRVIYVKSIDIDELMLLSQAKMRVKRFRDHLHRLCIFGTIEKKDCPKMEVAIEVIEKLNVICDEFIIEHIEIMRGSESLQEEIPGLARHSLNKICELADTYWRALTEIKRKRVPNQPCLSERVSSTYSSRIKAFVQVNLSAREFETKISVTTNFTNCKK